MPVYSFECPKCLGSQDIWLPIEERKKPQKCQCGKRLKRVPERFTADTFEPYHDEGLGVDIHSRQEKRDVMKDLGVIETGDRVGGARDFDEKAPDTIGKLPLQGKQHNRAKADGSVEEQIVETVDEKGNVVSRGKLGDLSSDASDMNWSQE